MGGKTVKLFKKIDKVRNVIPNFDDSKTVIHKYTDCRVGFREFKLLMVKS